MAFVKSEDLPGHLRDIDHVILAAQREKRLELYRGVADRGDVEQLLGLVVENDSFLEKGVAIFPITEGSERGNYVAYLPFRF